MHLSLRTKGEKMSCSLPAVENGNKMAEIKLELQLVADFGVMDVPNAGKYILLNALTLMNECSPQDSEELCCHYYSRSSSMCVLSLE